jgi:hypothetical protein
VFWATCGVTLKSRMSDTKSAVSKPLSAPTVMRLAHVFRGFALDRA